MDADRFDALTQSLAAGAAPRRDVLRLLAGGTLGGLLAALGVKGAAADHGCLHAGGRCKKHGQCCSGKCSRKRKKCVCTAASCTTTDPCKEAVCSSKFRCDVRDKTCGGGTGCSIGTTDCNGVCVDLNTDVSNCGGCGNVCGGSGSCQAGTCVPLCGDGYCDAGGGETCENCSHDCEPCGT